MMIVNAISESIRDEKGLVDVAYLSLFWLMCSVLGVIFFVCAMSAWSFATCVEVLDKAPPLTCRFDPGPIGTAVGLVCGGFATALGALGLYMAATRPKTIQPAPTNINVEDAGTLNVQQGKTGLPSAIQVR